MWIFKLLPFNDKISKIRQTKEVKKIPGNSISGRNNFRDLKHNIIDC